MWVKYISSVYYLANIIQMYFHINHLKSRFDFSNSSGLKRILMNRSKKTRAFMASLIAFSAKICSSIFNI